MNIFEALLAYDVSEYVGKEINLGHGFKKMNLSTLAKKVASYVEDKFRFELYSEKEKLEARIKLLRLKYLKKKHSGVGRILTKNLFFDFFGQSAEAITNRTLELLRR
jgi:hypothetical protein